jgi:hypothetical protein
VAGLVYAPAFTPEKGESVETLIQNPVEGAPVPPIMPQEESFSFWIAASLRLPSPQASFSLAAR